MNTAHTSHDVSYNVENILVNQKNRILRLSNEGRHEHAIYQLGAVIELWVAADYAYKGQEVVDRIVSELDDAMRPLRPSTKKWQALAELRYTAIGQRLAFNGLVDA